MAYCPRIALPWLLIKAQVVDILPMHDVEDRNSEAMGTKALAGVGFLRAW